MKPNVLYHGSPDKNIGILEPREESQGHKLPGKYVFASQYPELAVMFLAPKIGPMQISKFNDDYILIACCTEPDYRKSDRGGAIYELPPETFERGDSDMPEAEWFSSRPIIPINQKTFSSSLEAMKQYGAKVYFVDTATYAAIQNAEDHGWSILQSCKSGRRHPRDYYRPSVY